jgi:septin family protein
LDTSSGELLYGRRYPWGVCDINNPTHSDFSLLYRLLIGYFSQACITRTKDIYRRIIEERSAVKKEKQRVK